MSIVSIGSIGSTIRVSFDSDGLNPARDNQNLHHSAPGASVASLMRAVAQFLLHVLSCALSLAVFMFFIGRLRGCPLHKSSLQWRKKLGVRVRLG
jgi:hypothetical protein